MKFRTLVSILILVLGVLIIIGSCATGKKAVKAPIEPLYGTWANPDYNTKGGFYAKVKVRPDGIIEAAIHTELEYQKYDEATFTLIDSWMDSDGNKYYKMDLVRGINTWYELWRINETDSVFEWVWSQIEYPSEIDPNHPNYRILYRQQNVFDIVMGEEVICIYSRNRDKELRVDSSGEDRGNGRR